MLYSMMSNVLKAGVSGFVWGGGGSNVCLNINIPKFFVPN